MTWVLEFTSVSTGDVVGRVTYDGIGAVDVSPSIKSVVDGRTDNEMLADFDGWSNGYVNARKVEA